jgi:hypothetical protein
VKEMEQSDKNPVPAMSEQPEAPSSKRLIAGTFSSISDAELMLATMGTEAADYEENQ